MTSPCGSVCLSVSYGHIYPSGPCDQDVHPLSLSCHALLSHFTCANGKRRSPLQPAVSPHSGQWDGADDTQKEIAFRVNKTLPLGLAWLFHGSLVVVFLFLLQG